MSTVSSDLENERSAMIRGRFAPFHKDLGSLCSVPQRFGVALLRSATAWVHFAALCNDLVLSLSLSLFYALWVVPTTTPGPFTWCAPPPGALLGALRLSMAPAVAALADERIGRSGRPTSTQGSYGLRLFSSYGLENGLTL